MPPQHTMRRWPILAAVGLFVAVLACVLVQVGLDAGADGHDGEVETTPNWVLLMPELAIIGLATFLVALFRLLGQRTRSASSGVQHASRATALTDAGRSAVAETRTD